MKISISKLLPVLILTLFISALFFVPDYIFARVPPPAIKFQNPLSLNTVEALLSNILKTIQMIIGILAIVFIVVGGIIYITSAGDEKRTSMAKTAIWAAIIGVSLAFVAPSFLKEIYDVVDVKGKLVPAEAKAAKTLSEILLNILKSLMSFIGGLSVLMIVVGGVIYITSAGDEKRSEMGKNTIKYAIAGIVIALISLVIIKSLAKILV